MSEASTFDGERVRVRATSLLLSAVIVTATCALLLALSRVVAYLDEQRIAGVEVEMAPRAPPRTATRRPPAQRTTDASAPPTLTPLPVDRGMLRGPLPCSTSLEEERPRDCPRFVDIAPDEALDTRAPRAPMQAFTAAEQAALFSAIDPPCTPGLSTNTRLAMAYCARIGITPQRPSRSAEDICLEGGVGPCTPPPFRPEDVVRLAHTQ